MLPFLLSAAHAFCGFYVGGADAELYNDATLTVLMRDGTRTVLSMQNTYQGPPEDFALVVPVPQVLDKQNVKTLPRRVFKTIDTLSAPRLVKYWEQDPCFQPKLYERTEEEDMSMAPPAPRPAPVKAGMGVTIEAQFKVAEYDILILSAKYSSGLEKWLQKEDYNIPDGASDALRPYVQSGTKFFVAKVDPERVTFDGDRAVLSPLRMHYDSETFQLPIRLGLLNSNGEQDLLVHILGKNKRYELANYANTTIPTNLRVSEEVLGNFPAFYEAMFANTIADQPGAVVTEYSWQSSSCDPCPGPTLTANDVMTLGGDVLGNSNPGQWTLTRLHYRYGPDAADEDLVFREAEPMIGGRGTPDAEGRFNEAVQASSENQFQGRYAVLHPWEAAIECKDPRRGIWGGPGGQGAPPVKPAGDSLAKRAPASIDFREVVLDESFVPSAKASGVRRPKREETIPEVE